MLGGDSMRFLSFRLTGEGEAWPVEQTAAVADLSDAGAFGPATGELETIMARIIDNVLRFASGIHAINRGEELLSLDWFREADREHAALVIPDSVLKDAWGYEMHYLCAALSKGCFGHRMAGKVTKLEAKMAELNSPTEASAAISVTAAVEGMLLRKLGSEPKRARELHQQLGKKQKRDHFPTVAGVRAGLDRLVQSGRVTSTGEGDSAAYVFAAPKNESEEV